MFFTNLNTFFMKSGIPLIFSYIGHLQPYPRVWFRSLGQWFTHIIPTLIWMAFQELLSTASAGFMGGNLNRWGLVLPFLISFSLFPWWAWPVVKDFFGCLRRVALGKSEQIWFDLHYRWPTNSNVINRSFSSSNSSKTSQMPKICSQALLHLKKFHHFYSTVKLTWKHW